MLSVVWLASPTNSSQSDTLQVKSLFLVKSPKFWYILGSSNVPIWTLWTKYSFSSSFFFRSYIPLDLQYLHQSRNQFRISLKRGNKVESKKICLYLNKQIESHYEQIRMGKLLTIEVMKRILKKEIEKSSKHSSWFSYVTESRYK